MKINLTMRVPSGDFPDDILVEFESFYYFHFDTMLEAFPNSNLPAGFTFYNTIDIETPRRELFKTLSSYHNAVEKLNRMVKLYATS
jgi:hypothetical protein